MDETNHTFWLADAVAEIAEYRHSILMKFIAMLERIFIVSRVSPRGKTKQLLKDYDLRDEQEARERLPGKCAECHFGG